MDTSWYRRLDDWVTWFKENMGRPQLFYAAVLGTQQQQQTFLKTMVRGNAELMDGILEAFLDVAQFKEGYVMSEPLRSQAARTLYHYENHINTLMSPERTWKFLLDHQWDMLRMFLLLADELSALHKATTEESTVEVVRVS